MFFPELYVYVQSFATLYIIFESMSREKRVVEIYLDNKSGLLYYALNVRIRNIFLVLLNFFGSISNTMNFAC
jgi:hypothetical protein